jgi:hypothetical protein
MTTERVLAFAPENEGLDARDRERAASLADEGGAAGAIVERQESRQESRPPRTPSAIAVAFAAAAGVLAAIMAWRLREEVTMKSASMPTPMPTPRPRPDPPRAPEAKPWLPREDDGWNRLAAFDDDCETPARPFRVPAELLEGQR